MEYKPRSVSRASHPTYGAVAALYLHDPVLVDGDSRVLEARSVRFQGLKASVHVRELASRCRDGRTRGFEVDLESHGVELLSTEGSQEFVFHHIRTRGEVYGQFELV